MILLLAGLLAATALAAGCAVCLVVWMAGRGLKRVTEVCPPSDKS